MENLKIKSVYEFDKNEIEYLNEKYQVTKAVAVCFLGKTKFTLDEKGNVRISGEAAYGAFDKEQWKNIKRIVNGKKHIVGLKNDGTVVAYGDNSNGQCNVADWKNVVSVDIDGDKTIGFTKNGMLETHKKEVILPEEEALELKRPTRNNAVGAALGSSNSAVKNNVKSENVNAQGKCGENASYKLIGNTLYIDGTGTLDAKTLAEGSTIFHTSRLRYLPNEIENVIISDGITEIGDYAFCDCTSLKSITIPNSVKKIGDNAFGGCKALEVITIPRSVTYIGKSAFDYRNNLTINGEAGSYAQRYKKDFEAVTSKNSDNSKEIVRKPKKKAFIFAVVAVLAVVGAVGAVVLGNNNSTVKNNVNTASSANMSSSSYYITSYDDTLYDYELEPSTMPSEGKLSETITFKLVENTLYIDGTGEIFSGLFTEYSNTLQYIEYILLSDGITEIGGYTFDSCENLKSITIPDSVTKIGAYTFKNCTSLKSITVPSSVTEIGEGAFRGCTSLESVTIPRRVINIGEGAFWGCGSLTIHGEAGSYAERYAKEADINFGSI